MDNGGPDKRDNAKLLKVPMKEILGTVQGDLWQALMRGQNAILAERWNAGGGDGAGDGIRG